MQVVESPSLWYCYPGPRITYRAYDLNWTHRHVAFRGALAETWESEGLLGLSPLVLDREGERHMVEQFDLFLNAYDRSGCWASRYQINLLGNLLISGLEERTKSRKSKDLKQVISRWFREEGFQNPNVSDWSDRLGLGESTFRRAFVNEVGKSLHQFCMELRVEEASFLLSQSELTQEQVAENCGYCNVHHFSKNFRKSMGMTPGAYRKKIYSRVTD